MTSRRRAVLMAMALLLSPRATVQAQVPIDQDALPKRLLGDDIAEQSRALDIVEAQGLEKASPALRAALITALEREGTVLARRDAAHRRGEIVEAHPNPEYILQLARLVADMRDPRTIPALAGALGTGMRVVRALTPFGDAAAPAVLQIVGSPTSSPDAVDDGLVALRLMVEAQDTRPLTAGTLNQIRRVAEQRLNQPGYLASTGVTLRGAIDLAVVTRDPRLRQIVEAIASDPNEVLKRGVEDPELIAKTQTQARDRLAGVLPQPRR